MHLIKFTLLSFEIFSRLIGMVNIFFYKIKARLESCIQ